MKRYQLAKLAEWAHYLKTRKRLQKVVFLLQIAGCPVEADYRLHFFGPYSDDVAHQTDEMVQAGLLEEEGCPFNEGQIYNYRLSDRANETLAEFERTKEGKDALAEVTQYEALAKELLGKDVKLLEHAATLAYFHQRAGLSWPDAIERTCRMKKLKTNSLALRQAEELAKHILPKDQTGGTRGRQNLS